MKKTIGYTRVSSEEQVTNYSLANQEYQIKRYCSRFNYENLEIIREEGESARSLNRHGMSKLIKMIENDEVETLVVIDLDRLHRNVADQNYFINLCIENNVYLDTVYSQYDLKTAQGKMQANIAGSFYQYDSDYKSERSIDSMKQMAREGKYPFGGKVPIGYKKDDNFKLSLVRYEVKMIQDLFYQYAYELKSEHEIAVIAKSKYDLKLSKSNIRSFLVKDIYFGYVTVAGEKFNIIDSILSDTDCQQLQVKGIKNSFSKHDYKFRNKVYINGVLAKHQTKNKNGKVYKYYYLRGFKYIEEKEISKHIIQNKLEVNENGLSSIEEKGVQLFRALLFGDMDKIQFDNKLVDYNKEIKRKEQSLIRVDIVIGKTGNITFKIK